MNWHLIVILILSALFLMSMEVYFFGNQLFKY